MDASLPPQQTGSDYLDEYACTLGRLVGNLLSLELCIRLVLHEYDGKPRSHSDLALTSDLRVGDQLQVNALTSWDSLGQLIDKYNAAHSARPDLQLDTTLKTLRDAFAHGRILSDDPGVPLRFVRLSQPRAGAVTVEMMQPLTVEWMRDQVRRVRESLVKTHARLREFPSQQQG